MIHILKLICENCCLLLSLSLKSAPEEVKRVFSLQNASQVMLQNNLVLDIILVLKFPCVVIIERFCFFFSFKILLCFSNRISESIYKINTVVRLS